MLSLQLEMVAEAPPELLNLEDIVRLHPIGFTVYGQSGLATLRQHQANTRPRRVRCETGPTFVGVGRSAGRCS
jgi:hypothetical protein